MSKMMSAVQQLGTDAKTLEHVEWLLKQDKSLIMDILDESDACTLDDTLIGVANRLSFWENSVPVMNSLLNDYTKDRFIRVNENIEVKLYDISAHKSESSPYYSIKAMFDVFVDGVHKYTSIPSIVRVLYNRDPQLHMLENVVQKLALDFISCVKLEIYEVPEDALEFALALQSIKRDIENIDVIFDACDYS